MTSRRIEAKKKCVYIVKRWCVFKWMNTVDGDLAQMSCIGEYSATRRHFEFRFRTRILRFSRIECTNNRLQLKRNKDSDEIRIKRVGLHCFSLSKYLTRLFVEIALSLRSGYFKRRRRTKQSIKPIDFKQSCGSLGYPRPQSAVRPLA